MFFCLVMSVPEALRAATYDITEVVPPEGYTDSRAYGINNSGVVVGRFFNFNRDTKTDDGKAAYRWNSSTDNTLILGNLGGQSSAWAVSEGYAVGYSYNSDQYSRPVRWDISTGAVIDLGTFANASSVYGNEGTCYGVDASGNVVGDADIPNDANDYTLFHAFLYSNATSEKLDIGKLNTTGSYYAYGYSIAYHINSNQVVVGVANNDSWGYDPFIYDATNGIRALNKDASYSAGEWYATAINDNGLVVGHVIDPVTTNRIPFYWADATANPAQLTLPSNFSSAEIYSVNSAGQMVGIMWGSGGADFAFVYDGANGVIPLNMLIAPNSGWFLENAVRINETGQIVGTGRYKGSYRGFLLNPGTACALPVNNSGASTYYRVIQTAYNEASSGQTLQIQGLDFAENVNLNKNIIVKLSGGYDCNYSGNPGFSTVNGSLTISGATVKIANLIIR
jgi:hypothetical protein